MISNLIIGKSLEVMFIPISLPRKQEIILMASVANDT